MPCLIERDHDAIRVALVETGGHRDRAAGERQQHEREHDGSGEAAHFSRHSISRPEVSWASWFSRAHREGQPERDRWSVSSPTANASGQRFEPLDTPLEPMDLATVKTGAIPAFWRIEGAVTDTCPWRRVRLLLLSSTCDGNRHAPREGEARS